MPPDSVDPVVSMCPRGLTLQCQLGSQIMTISLNVQPLVNMASTPETGHDGGLSERSQLIGGADQRFRLNIGS
jgi:hypothetical protein